MALGNNSPVFRRARSDIGRCGPPSPSVVRHVTEDRLLRVQKPAASRLLVPHCGKVHNNVRFVVGPIKSRGRHGRSSLRAVSKRQFTKETNHLLSNSFQRSCPPNSGGFCRRRRRRRRRATNVTTSRQRQCTLLALFGRCEIDAIMEMLIFELSRVTSDGTPNFIQLSRSVVWSLRRQVARDDRSTLAFGGRAFLRLEVSHDDAVSIVVSSADQIAEARFLIKAWVLRCRIQSKKKSVRFSATAVSSAESAITHTRVVTGSQHIQGPLPLDRQNVCAGPSSCAVLISLSWLRDAGASSVTVGEFTVGAQLLLLRRVHQTDSGGIWKRLHRDVPWHMRQVSFEVICWRCAQWFKFWPRDALLPISKGHHVAHHQCCADT